MYVYACIYPVQESGPQMIFVDGVEVLKLPQRYIIITLNCKNSEINFRNEAEAKQAGRGVN